MCERSCSDPKEALSGSKPGQVYVDMTTSRPTLAAEIYEAALSRGVHTLDAPVSGGDVGAKNATLSIMVGGDREVFEQVLPLLELMGTTIVHQGPAGCGQHAKMVNQTLIATNMIGVCEALLYAYRAGLDLDTVLKSVSSGAAGSWSLANLAPRIMNNDFEPGFFVQHFVKDMAIALEEANRMGLALPGLALAHQLYVALEAQGKGHMGTQALQLALRLVVRHGLVSTFHFVHRSTRFGGARLVREDKDLVRQSMKTRETTTTSSVAFDPESIRGDFPILHQEVHKGRPLIYLDNAASTQRPQCVIDAIVDCYQHSYANVHRGLHALSERSTSQYELARNRSLG